MAREGNVEMMERVLERFAQTKSAKKKKLNSKDDNDLTPLHYAARYHQYAMMQCLVYHGASESQTLGSRKRVM